MKKEKSTIAIILLLIVLTISMYLISSSYMMAPDEYNYSHIAWTDTKLGGWQDIVTSQMSMYEQWTGRIPVHTMIQSMLYLGTWIYQLINPIMMIVFILLIGKIVFPKINYRKTILTLFLILFGIQGLGEKFIWLSGSVNYLWTSTIMLGVMYYYYQVLERNEPLTTRQIIILLLLSFFCGWSQENVAFVLGSFLLVIGLSNWNKFWKMENKQKISILVSIVLFGIGALLLLLAPGNFTRMNTSETHLQFTHITTNFVGIKYLLIAYLISFLGIFYLTVIGEKKPEEKPVKIWKSQLLFLLPMMIALAPMTIITEFPIRAMLPYEVMIIVLIVTNVEFGIQQINLKKLAIIASLFLTLLVGYVLAGNVSFAQKYMKPYQEKIQKEIEIAQKQGGKEVILTRFNQANIVASKRRSMLVDFSPTLFSHHIINQYMATYYGFDKIEAIGENEILAKVYLQEDIPSTVYPIINTITGEKVRETIKEEETKLTHEIAFIILKEELGTVKLELPQEIQPKILQVQLNTIDQKQEVVPSEIIK